MCVHFLLDSPVRVIKHKTNVLQYTAFYNIN